MHHLMRNLLYLRAVSWHLCHYNFAVFVGKFRKNDFFTFRHFNLFLRFTAFVKHVILVHFTVPNQVRVFLSYFFSNYSPFSAWFFAALNPSSLAVHCGFHTSLSDFPARYPELAELYEPSSEFTIIERTYNDNYRGYQVTKYITKTSATDRTQECIE